MQREERNKRELFLGDTNPPYMSYEKKTYQDGVSRNTDSVEMGGAGKEKVLWVYGQIARWPRRLRRSRMKSA